MGNGTSADDQRERDEAIPDTTGTDWVTITDLKVSSGRIHVRKKARQRHDIGEPGQVLDVVVHLNDGRTVFLSEVPVGAQHKIIVPPHKREIHDLEGEFIDIEVRDTGLRSPV